MNDRLAFADAGANEIGDFRAYDREERIAELGYFIWI